MVRRPDDDSWNALLRWAELLVVLIFYSALSGAFWVGVAVGANWMVRQGYGAPGVIVLATCVVVAIPALYAQLAMIIDAVGRILIDHVGIVPRLLEPPRRWPVSPLVRTIVTVISVASPLSGASALCLYSVTDTARPFDIVALKARAEVDATATALARLRTGA
jgi:hypothetical protein